MVHMNANLALDRILPGSPELEALTGSKYLQYTRFIISWVCSRATVNAVDGRREMRAHRIGRDEVRLGARVGQGSMYGIRRNSCSINDEPLGKKRSS